MPQIRDIFTLGQPQNISELVTALNPILNRLADRLDRMEGLRGNPRFYGSIFDFPRGNLDVGQVMRVSSSNQMEVSPITLADIQGAVPNLSDLTSVDEMLRGFLSVYDENGTLIHEFPFSQITELSEVHGFLQSDASVWNPGGSSVAPVDDLLTGLLSVSDENNTVVHQLPFTQVVELSEIHGFLQSAPSIWNPDSSSSVDVCDERGTVIHEFPDWQVTEFSEVNGFFQSSPSIWNPPQWPDITIGSADNGDTGPSVAGLTLLRTANTVPTSIYRFLNGADGQFLIVQIGDNSTTIAFSDAGNYLWGNNQVDYVAAAGEFLICVKISMAYDRWSVRPFKHSHVET